MKNKKTFIIVISILVIAAVGYIVFSRVYTPKNSPDTNSQGKLNINVVCESALSYMSFRDGASADKFVAECKEGKHPEVIEHYKAQMNFGDGAKI